MKTYYVKNMVCDRCKAAVRSAFEQTGASVMRVELGYVDVEEELSDTALAELANHLYALGFEMLRDSRQTTVERIKTIIIESLRYSDSTATAQNMSTLLADQLHSDYSALSKLFSASTGSTIEKYVITQKVEYVKELLSYGELTLTEIARRLGYSSVAYLSAQFKSVVGVTPSAYKASTVNNRKQIDKI